jgi:hypothetical protein
MSAGIVGWLLTPFIAITPFFACRQGLLTGFWAFVKPFSREAGEKFFNKNKKSAKRASFNVLIEKYFEA